MYLMIVLGSFYRDPCYLWEMMKNFFSVLEEWLLQILCEIHSTLQSEDTHEELYKIDGLP
jgi:hypothetical protein